MVKGDRDTGGVQPNPELYELSMRIPQFSEEELGYLVRLIKTGGIFQPQLNQKVEVSHSNMPTIEVAGQPRSLKTTMIQYSMYQLRSMGVKADFIPEPRIDVDKRKYPVEYTLLFGAELQKELLTREKKEYEVLLLDRGIFDRIGFLYAQSVVREIDYASYLTAKAYLLTFFSKFVDGLIICNCSSQASLRREGNQTVLRPIMQKDYLDSLGSSYRSLPTNISVRDPFYGPLTPKINTLPVVSIDTTWVGQNEQGRGWKQNLNLLHSASEYTAEVETWDEYANVFFKSIGTFSRIYTSGGKIH